MRRQERRSAPDTARRHVRSPGGVAALDATHAVRCTTRAGAGRPLPSIVQARQPRRERHPVEESPDTTGQGGRETDPGKPAGKCHRNTPPMAGPLQSPAQARLKWCGKSAPASRRRGGSANPTRCKAKQDRLQAARQGPGRPQRWMAVHDRIRLTGLLRKSPAHAGFFYTREDALPRCAPSRRAPSSVENRSSPQPSRSHAPDHQPRAPSSTAVSCTTSNPTPRPPPQALCTASGGAACRKAAGVYVQNTDAVPISASESESPSRTATWSTATDEPRDLR